MTLEPSMFFPDDPNLITPCDATIGIGFSINDTGSEEQVFSVTLTSCKEHGDKEFTILFPLKKNTLDFLALRVYAVLEGLAQKLE